jgi:hypothetical protein
MQARLATARLDGTRRLWRAALAAVVSLAVLASLFNCCCCFDGNEDVLTVAAVQTTTPDDDAGKTPPCPAGAHCCHCLAHVATVAPQNAIIASIEYTMRHDRLPAVPALDGIDLESPFKPPRA